jgi:hypothetical protein
MTSSASAGAIACWLLLRSPSLLFRGSSGSTVREYGPRIRLLWTERFIPQKRGLSLIENTETRSASTRVILHSVLEFVAFLHLKQKLKQGLVRINLA